MNDVEYFASITLSSIVPAAFVVVMALLFYLAQCEEDQ